MLESPLLLTLLLMIALFLMLRTYIARSIKRTETEAEQRMRELLAADALGEIPEAGPAEGGRGKLTLNERLAVWVAKRPILQQKEGRDFLEQLDVWLHQAGLRSRYTPEQALAQAISIWTVGVGGLILMRIAIDFPAILFLPCVIFCAVYPPLKLRSAIRERQDSIKAEIPFFIQQLYMALSSGMATIDEAIVRVARTAEEDPYESILAREFAQAQLEYRMGGKTQEEALRGISERTGVVAVENLVEALIQGLRVGTEMRKVLAEYADQAREMWRQDMRIYQNRKQPLVTLGLVITMLGGVIIYATPLVLEVFKTIGGLGGAGGSVPGG